MDGGDHNESIFSWETRGKGSAFLRVLYGQRSVVLTAAASAAPGNLFENLFFPQTSGVRNSRGGTHILTSSSGDSDVCQSLNTTNLPQRIIGRIQ